MKRLLTVTILDKVLKTLKKSDIFANTLIQLLETLMQKCLDEYFPSRFLKEKADKLIIRRIDQIVNNSSKALDHEDNLKHLI